MKLFDPIHQFIELDEDEKPFLEHPLFQRLLHIRQLGAAFHVYPGAVHNRFSHSLGVLAVATKIFDHITKTYDDPNKPYYRTLIRLASLYHDVGHLPLSHTAESFLKPHEELFQWLIESHAIDPLLERIEKKYPHVQRSFRVDFIRLVKGEPIEPEFLSKILTDNNFGADRIDYLLRDAYHTGLSYGHIDAIQLICCLNLSEEGKVLLHENGVPACEALLVARHWMHERLYQHPKVRSLQYHYAGLIVDYFDRYQILESPERFINTNDNDIFTYLKEETFHAKAILDPKKTFKGVRLPLEKLEEVKRLIEDGLPLFLDPIASMPPPISWIGQVKIIEKSTFWVYHPPSISLSEVLC